jgi:hypothetical protein
MESRNGKEVFCDEQNFTRALRETDGFPSASFCFVTNWEFNFANRNQETKQLCNNAGLTLKTHVGVKMSV